MSDKEDDDIPDTPEQRLLIEEHNKKIREKYPNLVELTKKES